MMFACKIQILEKWIRQILEKWIRQFKSAPQKQGGRSTPLYDRDHLQVVQQIQAFDEWFITPSLGNKST